MSQESNCLEGFLSRFEPIKWSSHSRVFVTSYSRSSFSPLQHNTKESVSHLDEDKKKLIECLYDGMTECIYQHPITSFTVETKPQSVFEVDILGKGRAALETANNDLGETSYCT